MQQGRHCQGMLLPKHTSVLASACVGEQNFLGNATHAASNTCTKFNTFKDTMWCATLYNKGKNKESSDQHHHNHYRLPPGFAVVPRSAALTARRKVSSSCLFHSASSIAFLLQQQGEPRQKQSSPETAQDMLTCQLAGTRK